jgi:hypothetical protein
MKPVLLSLLSAVVIAATLALPALAQEDPRDYLLGTQLVLKSGAQLSYPETNWWAELLPMEYQYAQGSIIKAVNEARAARGVSEMIAYNSYPIMIGSEMQVGSGWEYNIDFARMTPEDVAVVQAAFPFTGALSDLQQELRPFRVGWFNASSPEGNAVLTIFGQSETFTRDDSFNTARTKAAGLLERAFGSPLKFDFGFNCYYSEGGYNSLDVNLTVYLDGYDAGMGGAPIPYAGEGGI